jgi:hypothetical protein
MKHSTRLPQLWQWRTGNGSIGLAQAQTGAAANLPSGTTGTGATGIGGALAWCCAGAARDSTLLALQAQLQHRDGLAQPR